MLAFISWGVNPEFELRRKAVANSKSQENSGFTKKSNHNVKLLQITDCDSDNF